MGLLTVRGQPETCNEFCELVHKNGDSSMDDKARMKALRERLRKREARYRRELSQVREEITRT